MTCTGASERIASRTNTRGPRGTVSSALDVVVRVHVHAYSLHRTPARSRTAHSCTHAARSTQHAAQDPTHGCSPLACVCLPLVQLYAPHMRVPHIHARSTGSPLAVPAAQSATPLQLQQPCWGDDQQALAWQGASRLRLLYPRKDDGQFDSAAVHALLFPLRQ